MVIFSPIWTHIKQFINLLRGRALPFDNLTRHIYDNLPHFTSVSRLPILHTKKDQAIPYRIIYGCVKAPGMYVWGKTYVRNRNYVALYCVAVCCMHPVHYINSRRVTVDGISREFNSRGHCTSPGFHYRSYYANYLCVDVLNKGELPLPRYGVMSTYRQWNPNNMSVLGITNYAVALARFIYSRHFSKNSFFPKMIFEIKGKEVQNLDSGSSVWSNNSVLCLYDFLVNIVHIDKKDIDKDSFVRSVELGNIVVDDSILFACDAIIDVDDNTHDIIKNMLFTMSGTLSIADGTLTLRVAIGSDLDSAQIDENNIISITERDLLDKVQVQYTFDKLPNAAIAKIMFDNGTRLVEKLLPVYKESELLRRDGNRLCVKQLTLPFTTNEQIAKYLVRSHLFQVRTDFYVYITLSPRLGLLLKVHDVLLLSVSSCGWINKRLRVINWSYRDFKIHLVLCEDIIKYKYLS